jgi:curved DNA-binding protein
MNGFSDFFSTLFGGGLGSSGFNGGSGFGGSGFGGSSGFAGANGGFGGASPPPEDEAGLIEITVEEAYAGTKRRVAIQEGARRREVDVQVPAGIGDGQALRISAAGRSLILRVKIVAHPRYTLNGKDVDLELPLAPWEAALGAKVAVPTLGGTVELTIPAGAQSGQKLRLRGRGLPGSPAGDQFVILKIVTPAASTREARELYERMREDLKFDPRAGWP